MACFRLRTDRKPSFDGDPGCRVDEFWEEDVKEQDRSISKLSPAPSSPRSMIVFHGDAQQVSDGFALALEAMAANADLLMTHPEPIPNED